MSRVEVDELEAELQRCMILLRYAPFLRILRKPQERLQILII